MLISLRKFGECGADNRRRPNGRRAIAAAEFAVCMPVLVTFMIGVWEVGRVTEVANVMWNGAREAARDASLGQDNLSTVATNLVTYLQTAEPTAFNQGHSTTLAAATGLASGTYGYTCTDTTAN